MKTKTVMTKKVLASDGTEVYFDHYLNGHKKVIVIAHGFFNSKSAVLLKVLAERVSNSFDCIVLDFRGHGQTKGLFQWTSKEYLDLEAVLKFARINYEKNGVIGFSLGAATSLIAAAKFDLMDSLIAVSAPSEFGKIEYHLWDLDFENDIIYSIFKEGRLGKGVRPGPFWLKKEKPIDVVQNIKIPVFYIHGEADWLIRPEHSKKLFNQTASKKQIFMIKNGPHAEYLVRKNSEEFYSLIFAWFNETL